MKSINEIIDESKSIHDEFGNSLKIGDTVIFYFEFGQESKDIKKFVPRLYEGKLKSWDFDKLEGTIESKDFDQNNYNLPKSINVHQHLIKKA